MRQAPRKKKFFSKEFFVFWIFAGLFAIFAPHGFFPSYLFGGLVVAVIYSFPD